MNTRECYTCILHQLELKRYIYQNWLKLALQEDRYSKVRFLRSEASVGYCLCVKLDQIYEHDQCLPNNKSTCKYPQWLSLDKRYTWHLRLFLELIMMFSEIFAVANHVV